MAEIQKTIVKSNTPSECKGYSCDEGEISSIYTALMKQDNISTLNDIASHIFNLCDKYQEYYGKDTLFSYLMGTSQNYFGCGFVLGYNKGDFYEHCRLVLTTPVSGDGVNIREKMYLIYCLFDNMCGKWSPAVMNLPDFTWWLMELQYHLSESDSDHGVKVIRDIFRANDINSNALKTKIDLISSESGTDDFGDVLLFINEYLNAEESKKKSFLDSTTCRLPLNNFIYSYRYRDGTPDRREPRSDEEKKALDLFVPFTDIIPQLSPREMSVLNFQSKLYTKDQQGYKFATGLDRFKMKQGSNNIFVKLAGKNNKKLIANISGSATMILDGLSSFNCMTDLRSFISIVLCMILFMYPYDHSIHEILSASKSYSVSALHLPRDFNFPYDPHMSEKENIDRLISIMNDRKGTTTFNTSCSNTSSIKITGPKNRFNKHPN